jgi:hypothetical protein
VAKITVIIDNYYMVIIDISDIINYPPSNTSLERSCRAEHFFFVFVLSKVTLGGWGPRGAVGLGLG